MEVGYFYLCMRSKRQPFCAKSLTMHRLGGLFTIAMSIMKLGCLCWF